MDVISTKSMLSSLLQRYQKQGKTIGFVPTMGALHEGHLSLVAKSTSICDVTVVSIFVNPTQFNDKNDLANYPRCIEKDCALLEKTGCKIVFTPSVEEMYPEEDTRQFSFGNLDKVMEGEHRPGHFNGVAQIVSKLFDVVKPNMAFFGLKDFQQVAIIKEMVKQLDLNIEIIACPIIRENDGLAKSSRNQLLDPKHRVIAPKIHQTLATAISKTNSCTPNEICRWIENEIDSTNVLQTEYVQIVDYETLEPIKSFGAQKAIICVAVWAGKIRLIDNQEINPKINKIKSKRG